MENNESNNIINEKADEIIENNNKIENNNITILFENSKYKIEKVKVKEKIDDENIFKVILIGNTSVGKTSLSLRITEGLFDENTHATVGFDIFNFMAKINEMPIKLQIWDTCGLEDFSSCTVNFYKGASLVLVVYAINDEQSFKDLNQWINLVRQNSSPDILIFIVGNKVDLENERKIQKEEGEKYKEDNELNFFTESSAKTNEFVNELFIQAIIQLYEQNIDEKSGIFIHENFQKRKDSLKLNNQQLNKKKNKCC